MAYESPAVQYRGALDDVLRGLFPLPRQGQPGLDWRIFEATALYRRPCRRVGWGLDRACRELRLEISGAYAARLFKRCIGWA